MHWPKKLFNQSQLLPPPSHLESIIPPQSAITSHFTMHDEAHHLADNYEITRGEFLIHAWAMLHAFMPLEGFPQAFYLCDAFSLLSLFPDMMKMTWEEDLKGILVLDVCGWFWCDVCERVWQREEKEGVAWKINLFQHPCKFRSLANFAFFWNIFLSFKNG